MAIGFLIQKLNKLLVDMEEVSMHFFAGGFEALRHVLNDP
jgi:hypothetical protein